MPPNSGSTLNAGFFAKLLDAILHCSNLGNIILTGDIDAPTGTLLGYVFHDSSIGINYSQTPDNYIHDQADVHSNRLHYKREWETTGIVQILGF